MKRKLTIAAIVVLISISILDVFLLQGFAVPMNDGHNKIFTAFYNEEKDSLDAVYIGASSATRYWIPALAFHEEGITVSGLVSTNQPFVQARYLIEEAKKTQDSAMFIVELRWLFKNPNHVTEETFRRVTDNMKPSFLRLQAVHASLDYMNAGDNNAKGSALAAYFPALETIKRTLNGTLTEKVSFRNNDEESWNKGFLITETTFEQEKVPTSKYSINKSAPLDPKNEEILNELLDYCDTIDNEVLFVMAPYSAGNTTYLSVNTAAQIVESRGYTVLNMNTPDKIKQIGINWETDFYNQRHTNILGAEKYTRYLANYLSEEYHLKDHRSDPVFSDWHESYELYKERIT